jgi:thiamine-phosphate pyrophosphorylase
MFKHFNEIYHFIDEFKENDLQKLNSKVIIIYRNHKKSCNLNLIIKIKSFCKKNNKKFYLANNIKLSQRLGLDGAYISSFNSCLAHNSYNIKKNFTIVGSAHNRKEILIKEKQNVKSIFLSPLFKSNQKKNIGIYKFLLLTKLTKKKIIALGGINQKNFKKVKMINCYGFASISHINNLIR